MQLRVQAAGSAVVIQPGPRFGSQEVNELERRLRLLAPIELIVVELAAARDVEDSAVDRLAHALGRLAASVEFRGLSRHQRRLLRYLGHGTPEGEPLGSPDRGAASH